MSFSALPEFANLIPQNRGVQKEQWLFELRFGIDSKTILNTMLEAEIIEIKDVVETWVDKALHSRMGYVCYFATRCRDCAQLRQQEKHQERYGLVPCLFCINV